MTKKGYYFFSTILLKMPVLVLRYGIRDFLYFLFLKSGAISIFSKKLSIFAHV